MFLMVLKVEDSKRIRALWLLLGFAIGIMLSSYYIITSIVGVSMSTDGGEIIGGGIMERTSNITDGDWLCFKARNTSICHICTRLPNVTKKDEFYCYGLNVINSTKDFVTQNQIEGKIVWSWINPRTPYPVS